MAELQPDNTLITTIFDQMVVESDVFGSEVRFGIQTQSTTPRFSRLFFRTRRPIEEFQDFVQFMASRHPGVDVPPLPFHEAREEEGYDSLNAKVPLLHEYCKNLFEEQEIFDDPCMPLFLQSHKSMAEIREILENEEVAAAADRYQLGRGVDGNAPAAAAGHYQLGGGNDGNAPAAAAGHYQLGGGNDGNAPAAAAGHYQLGGGNDGNAPAAAAGHYQLGGGNDGNAPAAAAAAGHYQLGGNDENAPAAAAGGGHYQLGGGNDGNAQQEVAAAANDQQVPVNDGNAANNDQEIPTNDGNVQQAAAANPQVATMRDQDGNESPDGEFAAGSSSGNESDEPIFHMEDI